MPSRSQLRSLFTLCLLCLFSLQALAGDGVQRCQHARASSSMTAMGPNAGLHEHHQHQAGMPMRTAMPQHDHGAVTDFLTGCGCGCADRHCASSAAGLSAANPSAGIAAIHADAASTLIAATQPRDAHDRDLIRPPSLS